MKERECPFPPRTMSICIDEAKIDEDESITSERQTDRQSESEKATHDPMKK